MISGAELSEQQYTTNESQYSPGDTSQQVEGVPSTPSPTTPATPLECISYAQQEHEQESYPQVIRASDRDFLLFNHEVRNLLFTTQPKRTQRDSFF